MTETMTWPDEVRADSPVVHEPALPVLFPLELLRPHIALQDELELDPDPSRPSRRWRRWPI